METQRYRFDRLTIFLVGLIFLTIAIVAWPLVTVIILSLSLAVVTIPLHRMLSQWMKETISAAMTAVAVFLVIALLAYVGVAVVFENINGIVRIFNSLILSLSDLAGNIPYLSDLADRIVEALFSLVLFIVEYLTGLALTLPFLIIQVFILFLSYYLFILRGDWMWHELTAHLPPSSCASVQKLAKITVDTLYAVYIVSFEVSLYSFVVSIPIYYFLGYEEVLLLAILTGLFQLIPVLGPQILIALLAIYAAATGDPTTAVLILVIGYPVISGVADFILRPALMGGRVAISSILMMIGIFGGLSLLGFIGFILGPLFTALAVSAYEILIDQLKGAKDGFSANPP
jgi:predicted PurR-regulated permease PerM